MYFPSPFYLKTSISVLVAPNRIVILTSIYSLLLEFNLASFFKGGICFCTFLCNGFCYGCHIRYENKPSILADVVRKGAKNVLIFLRIG